MKQVTKRDGSVVPFDKNKIVTAIEKAMACSKDGVKHEVSQRIADVIEAVKQDWSVEQIQDKVEELLMESDCKEAAKLYINYRQLHKMARDRYSDLMDAVADKLGAKHVANQNANVDEKSFGGRLGEMTRLVAKQFALDHCMSKMARDNHLNNEIYIHDLDSYAVGEHNCLSIPFDDLLANGFNTRQTDVRPAQSVSTAFQLVAVIFQVQSLQQFGGVSATHLDWTMVPYVRKSFFKHYVDGMKHCTEHVEIQKDHYPDNLFAKCDGSMSIEDDYYKAVPEAYEYAIDMTVKETYQAVEGMYHNLNTLQSRSGNQLPFTSINYGTCTLPEGRLVTKALLETSIKGIGKLHRTSIFPCGIFQLMKGVNRKPGDSNYDLYRLALRSTAQRLYPNYVNVDWSVNEGYDRNDPRTYTSTMGCRTYNGYDINGFGQLKDGRGNIAPVTLILPTLAEEAKEYTDTHGGDRVENFMKYLDAKLNEAKDMLLERFEWICSQPVDSAKFMWENNTMYGFNGKDTRSALRHGTLAVGMLGMAETLQILIGNDQTSEEGMALAKKICALYKQRCAEFKNKYKLNFGVYFTPEHNRYCLRGLVR